MWWRREGRLFSLSEAATSSTSPPTAASSVYTAAASSASCLVFFAILGLWGVVDEESVEGQGVWEDKVADIVSADGEGV